LPLFKKGTAHVNNGQTRSLALKRLDLSWCLVSGLRRPSWPQGPSTVKPTATLEDALLDLTNRSDIVIDPFLSGSPLSSQPTRPAASVAASNSTRFMSM
jgi:DNA modification methylase